MKKYLVLALAALALVACGTQPTTATPTTATPTTATPTTAAPTIQTITIDKDDQTELKAACAGSVYHTGVVVNFETDGTKWAYSEDFGLPSSEFDSGFAEHNLFQVKKKTGSVYNTEALSGGYSLVTVKFYVTYKEEAAEYLPVVQEGTAADALTAVAVNEATPYAGEKVDWTNGTKDVYEYTCTYNVKAESTFFSIGSGAGLLFFDSVVIA